MNLLGMHTCSEDFFCRSKTMKSNKSVKGLAEYARYIGMGMFEVNIVEENNKFFQIIYDSRNHYYFWNELKAPVRKPGH